MPSRSARSAWAVMTVVFLTVLLRPPLAIVGPLLGQIAGSQHLNPAEIGFLTSAPVICFGLGAFAGPRLLRRFGLTKVFVWILVVLLIANATRAWFGVPYLLIGTVVIGLGIALSNVLFPTLILTEFPGSVAKLTAFYTTLLSGFSAIASGIAVPAAAALGGWQQLFTWLAVPTIFALVAWLITVRLEHPSDVARPQVGEHRSLWGHPLAWALAAFFGIQSANFYVMLNWLPTILSTEGLSPLAAGGMLAFMSSVGIPVGLTVTANLKRLRSHTTQLVLLISVVTATGVAMLLLGPGWLWPASILMGAGLASSFPLSLALIGMKGGNQANTTSLSAIAQGIGYLVAAAGVFLAGTAGSLLHSWTPVLLGLIVATAAQAMAGIYAAKHPTLA